MSLLSIPNLSISQPFQESIRYCFGPLGTANKLLASSVVFVLGFISMFAEFEMLSTFLIIKIVSDEFPWCVSNDGQLALTRLRDVKIISTNIDSPHDIKYLPAFCVLYASSSPSTVFSAHVRAFTEAACSLLLSVYTYNLFMDREQQKTWFIAVRIGHSFVAVEAHPK